MTELSQLEQRLTPDALQSVSFRAARLGRRGLDEEHVRAFCRQVEAELVAQLNERTALQEEVGRLRRRMLGAEDGTIGYRREDAHIQAVGILSRAQQTADHYVAEAQEYSRHLAEDARRRRDEILEQARSSADQVTEQAHQKASEAAQTMMAAPVAQPDGVHEDRGELEADLAYLRTYSDVYRTHLRAYLDALLRNVDEWEHAEKSSLSAVRSGAPRPDPPDD